MTLKLFQQISGLRLRASELYDAGKAGGIPDQELVEAIHPLVQSLHHHIHQASTEDCVVAIKHFQQNIESLKALIQGLEAKIADEKYHLEMIEKSVIAKMQKHDQTTLSAGPFLLTIGANEHGKDVLHIR